MLTQRQQAYFEQMEALFAHPAWKLVIDSFKDSKEALQKGIFSYDTEKSFFIAKGRAQAYDQIIGFEEFTESLKQNILDGVLKEQDDPSI